MEKIIIHSDLNNFYASVERAQNPSLEGKPIAVCGDEAARHGIVLAKSEQAKKFGVATGDAIWQAKRKCPDIVIVPPHFDLYIKYSRRVRDIYAQYTDLIENYGIDECWLDLSSSGKLFPPFGGSIKTADGEHYSEEYLRFLGDCIRNEVKSKTALTVSCGVSFNKVFAKLGSEKARRHHGSIRAQVQKRGKRIARGRFAVRGRSYARKTCGYGHNHDRQARRRRRR